MGMNNSFNDNIAQICGLELATLVGSYKYSVFGGTNVIIEGHKGISSYSDNEVSFLLGNKLLKVNGSKLNIKCLNRNFAVVVGDVTKVEVVDR